MDDNDSASLVIVDLHEDDANDNDKLLVVELRESKKKSIELGCAGLKQFLSDL